MGTGGAVAEEEVVMMDPDEGGPDELQRLVEEFRLAKLELETKTGALVSCIVLADEDPEPMDQNMVRSVVEDLGDLQNTLEDAQELLSPEEIEVPESPYLLNPSGYPEGTRRYRPLTPVQTKEVLSRGCWVTSEIKQVKVREGTILWVRQDHDRAPLWGPIEGDVIEMAPRAPVKPPPPPGSQVAAKSTAPPPSKGRKEWGSFTFTPRAKPASAEDKASGPRKQDRFPKKVNSDGGKNEAG